MKIRKTTLLCLILVLQMTVFCACRAGNGTAGIGDTETEIPQTCITETESHLPDPSVTVPVQTETTITDDTEYVTESVTEIATEPMTEIATEPVTEVLTEPITEQRAQGTKERPSWLPTGSFRWPTSGRITSYFGYRNTGVRGASTNHKGIDIANARGTSIYAADGGTVIYSGWKTAMGYTIIIDHGNGYETYYEHNSELLVSRGDHVFKGEKIARMGSTGVSSGNHCHFGIKKNGVYVNPLNYLP
jgi:murein DD-endopeptidase MepM/ murein hydrolase activator NlpD